MKAEPAQPSRDLIATTLRERWRITPTVIDYLPVGGGGQHWLITDENSTRWFVTANGLAGRGHWIEPDADAMFARTRRAYETVHDLDLEFALATVPDRTGSVLHRIHAEWALSVYPYLDSVKITERQANLAVAGFIARLHAHTPPNNVPRWQPELPQREHLERAIAERERAESWPHGPYSERTRRLLLTHHGQLNEMLHRYDRLVAAASRDPGPYVMTHGEPNAGNTLRTTGGATLLIDWDTLALAPPERDLWQLDRDVWRTAAERRPRADYLELFALWWRLSDTGSYIRRFRAPHSDDADSAAAWRQLRRVGS
ncbi:MAG TPA: hypothetical protein VHC49_20425 [Mycobacteriales bacterium]|nr:hypothetical protein [Mycobacteriales bacterium]